MYIYIYKERKCAELCYDEAGSLYRVHHFQSSCSLSEWMITVQTLCGSTLGCCRGAPERCERWPEYCFWPTRDYGTEKKKLLTGHLRVWALQEQSYSKVHAQHRGLSLVIVHDTWALPNWRALKLLEKHSAGADNLMVALWATWVWILVHFSLFFSPTLLPVHCILYYTNKNANGAEEKGHFQLWKILQSSCSKSVLKTWSLQHFHTPDFIISLSV